MTSQQSKVLIVDDDAVLAGLLVNVLEAHGGQGQQVTTFAAAVAKLQGDEVFSTLLTDYRLDAGFDGLELCRRAYVWRPEIQCILMSGHVMGIDLGELDPAPELLPKPFAMSEFIAKVL